MGIKEEGGSLVSFYEAKTKYRAIFEYCFQETENVFSEKGLSFYLTAIDQKALDAWRQQWGRSEGSWNWEALCQSQLNTLAKRLTIAIWDGNILVGLAFGKVSKAKRLVSFSYIQGDRSYTGPLKGRVASIVSFAAILIGKHVGASHVAFLDPVNSKVENHYANIGYRKYFLYGIRKSMFLDIKDL